jgi:hypothetical protein
MKMDCEYDFSKLWSLNWKDVGKGILTASGTAVIVPIIQSLTMGSLEINPLTMGTAALAAGITYLLKQLSTGADGKLLSKNSPFIN